MTSAQGGASMRARADGSWAAAFSKRFRKPSEVFRTTAGYMSGSSDSTAHLAAKFPCSVYYDIEGDTVRVHAVVDNRRNPAWAEDRVAGVGTHAKEQRHGDGEEAWRVREGDAPGYGEGLQATGAGPRTPSEMESDLARKGAEGE